MGLLAIGVIISLLAVLAFVSTQGCPAYFLNFPMRTVDCDLSNTLTMALELTVAGTFAIILGLIFYQKQKGDSDKIIELTRKQLVQSTEISKINLRIDEIDFENNRLNAIRILIRHFSELRDILERIKSTDKKGPYRSIDELNKRDEIIEKIEEVVDNVPLSHDPQYNLPFEIDRLLKEVKKTPGREDITKTQGGKFVIHREVNFDNVISRISSMETTLGGIQREILKKAKKLSENQK